jgi:hypothetical protein
VPAPSGALDADRLVVLLRVGDDEHFRVAGQVELRRLHDVQRTEALRVNATCWSGVHVTLRKSRML